MLLKNTITNQFGIFSNQQEGWIQATESEILAYELQEAKDKKIAEIKALRNEANLKPMVSVQAKEIKETGGQFTLTNNNKYFSFSVASTGQPTTEPNSIILGTILSSLSNPSHYLRYSCKIIEGGTSRSGYVAIDSAAAISIQNHMSQRTLANIAHANGLEVLINSATTVQEVEAIQWL